MNQKALDVVEHVYLATHSGRKDQPMFPGDRTFDREYLLSLDYLVSSYGADWKESSIWSLQKEAHRIITDEHFIEYKTNEVYIVGSVFVWRFNGSLYVNYSKKEDGSSVIWTESLSSFLRKEEAEAGGKVYVFKHMEREQG